METTRDWALPGLLVAVQLVELGPGASFLDTRTPGPLGAAGLLIAVVVETVALSRRRHTPVRTLVWTLGTSVLGQVAAYDAYADLGLLVALYSVAVRCPASVTSRGLVAAVGSSWVLAGVRFGLRPALATQLTIAASTYVVCVGIGLARRQGLARRLTATRLLAAAEETRRQAALDERGRLAQELHDVSAHHLTSVVVTVDAAKRLGQSRPELVRQAMEFTERTGHETLTALHRLVTVMRDAGHPDARPLTGRVQELVAGFGRLAGPISLDLPDDLAGPAAEAVHAIVREALTNTLRYAPGATVTVLVRRLEGTLELTVDNTEATVRDGTTAHVGMGSGRGLAGMRERAAAVGGELTAGPAPDGGWRVRARLPDATGPRGTVMRPRGLPHDEWLTDGALLFGAAALPLVFLLTGLEGWRHYEGQDTPRAVALVAALLALHALSLLRRRRSPWTSLAGVVAASWLWPVACLVAPLLGRVAPFLAGGLLAETVAVYSLGAYGRSASIGWPAPFVAAAASGAVLTMTAAADGSLAGETPSVLTVAVIALSLTVLLCPVYASAWGSGLFVRRRRLRAVARDEFALGSSRWEAHLAAASERHRLAERLHDAVLHHTTSLVRLARQGRLDEASAEARVTLAAMRELLHGLDTTDRTDETNSVEEVGPDDTGPRATVADLHTLCRTVRREVSVHGAAEVAAAGLPEAVNVAAYRLTEAALGAGDRGRARVRLRRRRRALLLTVTGVRLAVHGPVAERLRAQAAAAEARISFEQSGTVRVLLPLPTRARRTPASAREVADSPEVSSSPRA
ncbi:histidine kinase [Streptomyces sp. MBT65]|uniref:histidine kinase n=1 Tax=Streptomyces sp. MBT65 TaxID=1488395 RepID=UPI001909A73E|nr:histidine kinase [Streptomyces sp. MBT65]MBK3574590.1 histidine kinase [Streptomyces sp. MBT65]